MTPPSVDLVLCIAVGPGEVTGALDVLDAARAYLDGRYRVVVVDDTGGARLWAETRRYAEADYLRNWRRRGFRHLIASVQRAYRHALAHYDFAAVLKLDADALIIGPGLAAEVVGYLETHPRAGMLGAVAATESGRAHWRAMLDANRPDWADLLDRAARHGYEPGESALGGAYALSRRCLADIEAAGYLARPCTGPRIAEDVTVALFARALGYEIHEWGGPDQPLHLAWRGLPAPKEELVARKKAVIHSVKFGAADLAVRAYFDRLRRRRVAGAGTGAAPASPRRPPEGSGGRRLRVALRCRRAAVAAIERGRIDRARERLRAAVAVDPWQPVAWGLRAACELPGGASRALLGWGRAVRRPRP